jgi:UDP-N-acetylmuramate dehydrogenase
VKGNILFDEPMERHTSFRIGGPAERFVIPSGIEDLQLLFREMPGSEKITMVGAGSNLLVSDLGIRGTVIQTTGLDEIKIHEDKASVGAGVLLPRLLRELIRRGLGGLEWQAGIPGTVGGAVRMNAGTGEGCMADRLVSVTLLDRSGKIEKLERREISFGYRRMELEDETWIVGAELLLEPEDPSTMEQTISERLKLRRNRQPLGFPSAGSIFKNPEGDFAGRLIEAAGMKGERVGDAEVSTVHANFIVNRGKARAGDVIALIGRIKSRVEETCGVQLELEIKVVGEFA